MWELCLEAAGGVEGLRDPFEGPTSKVPVQSRGLKV